MIEKTLKRIGLTEYEIKVFLHLVRNGTTGAVELAKRSGVPFGRIYDVLYQLESKGFVKVLFEKPKKFAPVDPKMALESTVKKMKENFEEIEKEAVKDKEELQKQFSLQEKAKKPSIWMFSGDKNIREARRRELSEAKEEINAIVSSDISTGRDIVVERLAREAKGITRRFIENPLTKDDEKKIKDKIKGGAKVKLSSYKGFTLSIVDKKIVRVEVKDSLQGRTSVIIENEDLAKALNEFFMEKWNKTR